MSTTLEETLKDPECRELYAEVEFESNCLELLSGLMQDKGMSYAELGSKICLSEDGVKAFFAGENNVTLVMVAKIAYALGGVPQLCVFPDSEEEQRL